MRTSIGKALAGLDAMAASGPDDKGMLYDVAVELEALRRAVDFFDDELRHDRGFSMTKAMRLLRAAKDKRTYASNYGDRHDD